MSEDSEACNSSKCPKKTAKKFPEISTTTRKNTQRKKQKNKQTNKQNPTRSFCCWLMDVRPKHMENLQWSSHVNEEGWWGFCFENKIFKRKRIWGGTTFVTLYNILHKSQLSLCTHPLHILCKQTKQMREYKSTIGIICNCVSKQLVSVSPSVALAVRCTLPKNIKHYSCFQTLVPYTSWCRNKNIMVLE